MGKLLHVDFSVNGEKRTLKDRFYDATRRFSIWWSENREWAIIVLPAATGLAIFVIKKLINGGVSLVNARNEKILKDLYCYDHSEGHYWKLMRKLTTSEWLEVQNRRKMGEKLGDILRSMRVI